MIGAGVLGLPQAISFLGYDVDGLVDMGAIHDDFAGEHVRYLQPPTFTSDGCRWYGGIVVLVLSWVISLYTLHQLVALHEFNGKRFNRYHELGQYAFGKRLGDIAIITPQLIVMVSTLMA